MAKKVNENNEYFIENINKSLKIEKPVSEVIKENMETYAKKVIWDRAIPDYRDGLKPVHRRILYAMKKGNYISQNDFWKSARVVGDTMGKYHPHGDKAIYDAIVNMVVEWKNTLPFIKGKGDFGNIDGDPAAAMRYSEISISPKVAEMIFTDMDVIDYKPNYDNKEEEPVYLPVKLPYAIINGTSGIAYGLNTNIPPFNKNEIIDAFCDMIDEKFYEQKYDESRLKNIIKGPDFPTGCDVYFENEEEYIKFLTNGEATVWMRATVNVDEKRKEIVITSVPYEVTTHRVYQKILELYRNYLDVKSGKKHHTEYLKLSTIPFNGTRGGEPKIILTFTKDADLNTELQKLYKYTPRLLEVSFNMKLRFIDENNRPSLISLTEYLQKFLKFRNQIIKRRTLKELEKLRKELEIQKAIYTAVEKIDIVQKIIKEASIKAKNENMKEVEVGVWVIEELMKRLDINKKQAQYIADMKIIKLSSIKLDEQKNKINKLIETIEDKEDFLNSDKRIYEYIKYDLMNYKDKKGRISNVFYEFNRKYNEEDTIENKEYIVLYTNNDKIYKVELEKYKRQRKGTKGKNISSKDEIITKAVTANALDYILTITDKGKVLTIKTYKIPDERSYIKNYINIDNDENVKVITKIKFDFFKSPEKYTIVFVTKNGIVKKTKLSEFKSLSKGEGTRGIIGIKLNDYDRVVNAFVTDKDSEILIIGSNNRAVRFDTKEISPTSRNSKGVIGIRFDSKDVYVINAIKINNENEEIIVFTEKGTAKKFKVSEIRKTKRGSKGVLIFKPDENDNASIIQVLSVSKNEDIVIITKNGIINRINQNEINEKSRTAKKANKILTLNDDDKVVAVLKIENDYDDN